jgi:ATP-dependent DNA ligase
VQLWGNGRDWTVEFVAITAAIMALPFARMVLDGEAVAHCPEGLPDFNALLRRSGCATACFYAVDLIRVGNEDLRGRELVERRALLRKHLKHAAGGAILYSEHLDGAGRRGDVPARLRHRA